MGFLEVSAPILTLVPVPLPLKDSGHLSVSACLCCPFVPALFTLLTSLLTLSLVASGVCPLIPWSLILSMCHPLCVSLYSSVSTSGLHIPACTLALLPG